MNWVFVTGWLSNSRPSISSSCAISHIWQRTSEPPDQPEREVELQSKVSEAAVAELVADWPSGSNNCKYEPLTEPDELRSELADSSYWVSGGAVLMRVAFG